MHVARHALLVWPGLPWLWLRGSVAGLVLAMAFAVVVDMAILSTWIWTQFLEGSVVIGLWAAAGLIWLIGAVSAVTAFPAPIHTGHDPAAEALFTAARDAYLARDWLAAETRLRSLLVLRPTDGEAQLLLGTLLRRAGRLVEARDALERLSRSDAGAPWRPAISRELARIAASIGAAERPEIDAPATLPIAAAAPVDNQDRRAA